MAIEIWILVTLAAALVVLSLANRLRRRRAKELAKQATQAGGAPGNVYPLW